MHYPTPVAQYLGCKPPPEYFLLNSRAFNLDEAFLYQQPISVSELAGSVKVIKDRVLVFPLVEPPDIKETNSIVREMRMLKDMGILQPLVGGREVSLSRGNPPNVLNLIRQRCPGICGAVHRVEKAIDGTKFYTLFLRCDKPRMSSTTHSNHVNDRNMHFDAGQSSIDDWSKTGLQVLLNYRPQPRVLAVLPVSLTAMRHELDHARVLSYSQSRAVDRNEILNLYVEELWTPPLEKVVVPPGHVAAFPGAVLPHDGRTPDVSSKYHQSKSVPQKEHDIVFYLGVEGNDPKSDSWYNLSVSFLDEVKVAKQEGGLVDAA